MFVRSCLQFSFEKLLYSVTDLRILSYEQHPILLTVLGLFFLCELGRPEPLYKKSHRFDSSLRFEGPMFRAAREIGYL